MNKKPDRLTLICQKLMQDLNPTQLDITDNSHLHAGHAGTKNGAGHYSVYIESHAFDGKTEIERHRMVYLALQEMMPREIHAVSIKTGVPQAK